MEDRTIQSDTCFICSAPTVRGWVFCEKCTPSTGSQKVVMGNGHINPFMAFIGICPKMRDMGFDIGLPVIRWWCGTDALTLHKFPPGKPWWPIRILLHRRNRRKMEPYITQHWADGPGIANELIMSGIPPEKVKIVIFPPRFHTAFEREEHSRFYVLYYHPKRKGIGSNQKYIRWVYGIDIIEDVKKRVKDLGVTWLMADGSLNMPWTYPITDFYARPSRHDGSARMRMEAEINEIPFYYREDFCPRADELEADIRRVYAQTRSDRPTFLRD